MLGGPGGSGLPLGGGAGGAGSKASRRSRADQLRRAVGSDRQMIESAQLEVVRATADGLCQHAEAGLLYPLYIREINQEIAHALADQPGHGGGALAVDLAAQAEHEMAVLDRRKHLQH